ncbi:hypothetical protein [Aquimarina sp. 2201CG5-10]|uniref:hypothetical protein n=1 Tax=Aquimarina callyspongiae TaxID=3098150 RepID=UPI002AB4ECCE|nr:hypothetical protein [Aquimarina sp. 2201CG5-10]MDY8134833.1 hypothetical protein [Aquimarina sp. 2201CG5-10]
MLKNILKLKDVQEIEKNQQKFVLGGGKAKDGWCQYGVPACCGSPAEGKCGTGLYAGGYLDSQGQCACV